MNSNQTKVSVVRGDEISFTAEARGIQDDARLRLGRVVRLGALVFFSTTEGEAWMLDPEDGLAACLAREGTSLPIPITENATQAARCCASRRKATRSKEFSPVALSPRS